MAKKAKKPPAKGSTLATMNTGQRSKRVAELVAAHNTAAIPDQYLPANLKAKRTQAVAAKQPLVPGGQTTVGQFQTERKAAVNQKFGAADTELATQAKQVPGWYDDYLKQLAGIQQRVTDSYGQLASQAGSLGASTAAPGVTGTPEAAAAGLNRENQAKAMQGSLIANQGQAVDKYGQLGAAGLARKTQRREEIAGQVKDLAKQKGDYATTYTADARQKEFENAATSSALGLKATTAADASKQKTADRAARVSTAVANRASQQAQTTQRLTSQEKQTQARLEASATQGTLNRAQKAELARLREKDKKPKPKGDWLTASQAQGGLRDVASLKSYAAKAKSGQPFVAGHQPQGHLNRHAAAKKLQDSLAAPKSPILLTAALDAVYDNHLSRDTVRKLIKAHYKPSEVAAALGVQTAGQFRKTHGSRDAAAKLDAVLPKFAKSVK